MADNKVVGGPDEATPMAIAVAVENPDGDLPIVNRNATFKPEKGTNFMISCIQSGAGIENLSQWTVPKTITVYGGFGGGEIDFRRATFVHDVTTVSVYGLCGGVSIIVPPGVRVESSGCAIAGGWGAPKEVSPAGNCDRPGAPVIVFKGLWLCGGCGVTIARPDDKVGGCC